MKRYTEHFAELRDAELVYPCVCARKDLEQALSAPQDGEDNREYRYPGTCRNRFRSLEEARAAANGREPCWRFRIDRFPGPTSFTDGFAGARTSDLADWSGDFIVARGEVPAYQLAVVVDDHDMGVTEAVRGDDLIPSTHRQLVLYRAFGWTPPAFFHIPLVMGSDGRRLAKRHGDTRVSAFRMSGVNAAAMVGWLAWTCGWVGRGTETTPRDLLAHAHTPAIPRAPVVVDPKTLPG